MRSAGSGAAARSIRERDYLRLFSGEVATEISWLLPTALAVGVVLVWVRRNAPRTDPVRTQAVLWLGWLLVTGLVFS